MVEKLVKEGYGVRAFVLYNSFGLRGWLDRVSPEILSDLEIFAGDIRDPFGVKRAMEGCDLVMHLAALIAIPYSYHSPSTYVETNIQGTLNVLQAANELGIEQVIHTSTSEVYGSAQFVPITEAHPLSGQSPYSATKIAADQLALSFYRSFGTPVTVIRPFNTYGPRQSARAVIPTVLLQIVDGATVINLGSVTPTRDFSFVKDTVSGFISAIGCRSTIGRVVNLGSGFEISIVDTANLIAELMGVDIKIAHDSDRFRPVNSEVDRLYADNSLAKELMLWEPEYAGLLGFKSGLLETIDWFSKPQNNELYKKTDYNI